VPRSLHTALTIVVTVHIGKSTEHVTNSTERSPWKVRPNVIKKFSAFYGIRRFITALTRAHHLSPSWASSIQNMSLPHSLKIHFYMILPSIPSSSKWSLSLRFPYQNPECTSPLHLTCHMPRPSHTSWFDHPNNIWSEAQIITFLVVYSSLLLCPLAPLSRKFSITCFVPKVQSQS
jgi:hypothetical protein